MILFSRYIYSFNAMQHLTICQGGMVLSLHKKRKIAKLLKIGHWVHTVPKESTLDNNQKSILN